MNTVKLLGIALVITGALLIGFGYRKSVEKTHSELLEYLSFLKHLKMRIALNGEPYSSACKGFSGEVLSENGFIDAIERGELPAAAFKNASASSGLGEKTALLLSEAFGALGKGPLTEEINVIEQYITKIESYSENEGRENLKRTKSMLAVMMAAVLGVCILII